MANVKGTAQVKIDGMEKTLKFDMNAFADLEELTGKTMPEILNGAESGNIGFGFIRNALYCGLKWGNKRLTPQIVGKMMDVGELKEYMTAVSKAIVSAMGVKEEDIDKELEKLEGDEDQNFPDQVDGIGSNS